MNNVTITGRLTGEPKLRHVGSERAVCDLRIAVDNGRHPTTYIDVPTFDGQAYTCAEYLTKGRLIGVSGRLALGEWHDASGQLHQRYSVIGRVEFLDRPHRPETEAPDGGEPDPVAAAQGELVLAS